MTIDRSAEADSPLWKQTLSSFRLPRQPSAEDYSFLDNLCPVALQNAFYRPQSLPRRKQVFKEVRILRIKTIEGEAHDLAEFQATAGSIRCTIDACHKLEHLVVDGL